MPNYGDVTSGIGATNASPTAIQPGDSVALFNSETVAAGQASMVIARAMGRTDDDAGITFFIEFAASPTDSLQILGSNKPPAAAFTVADWYALYTSTNKQTDYYTDTGRFAYYCALVATQSGGGKVTVIAQR